MIEKKKIIKSDGTETNHFCLFWYCDECGKEIDDDNNYIEAHLPFDSEGAYAKYDFCSQECMNKKTAKQWS